MGQKNYLTEAELAQLKTIRANNLDEKSLEVITNFLEKNGYTVKNTYAENRNNIYEIIKAYYQKNVLNNSERRLESNRMVRATFETDIYDLINETVRYIYPEAFKVWEIIKTFQVGEATRLIDAYEMSICINKNRLDNFNSSAFIWQKDYNLNQFSYQFLDKNLKEDAEAYTKVFDNMFTFFTKGLSDNQKEKIKTNILQSFQYYLNNDKRSFINYISNL